MTIDEIHVGSVISGPLLPEPVEVLAVVALGDSIKLIGKGCRTGLVRDPVLTPAQLSQLRCSPLHESLGRRCQTWFLVFFSPSLQ